MHILVSEWLRTKRTAIRWLTFFMPFFVAVCAIIYIAFRKGTTQEFIFEGFFTIWTAVIIPVGAGVLSGYIVYEEEMAGNFNGFLSSGISRTKLYLGKFLLLFFCSAICTFIAVCVLYIGINYVVFDSANIMIFLSAAVLVVTGTLPLLALHLWVSFARGMGASIGISFAGILMAVLFGTTNLGDNIWMFIPWAWPVKLGMLPGTHFIMNSGVISSSEIINNTTRTALVGLIVVVAALLLFLLLGILWFRKWENS